MTMYIVSPTTNSRMSSLPADLSCGVASVAPQLPTFPKSPANVPGSFHFRRMSMEDYERRYLEVFKAKGHSPKMEDREADFMAYSPDGHNGPICIICHFSACVHCDPKGEHIPECTAIKGRLA